MVRLTQMVTSAGCAAKIFPNILEECLKGIIWEKNENVLVGFEGKDDAGIYKIDNDLALIHTTDFFTPVVDDPYIYGQISAANSLSDIYAMGGVPMNALNIVGFPQKEDLDILREIIRGGQNKSNEGGCVIIGGHSVDIPTILYGLAVTGKINPNKIISNGGAKPGDLLILTKAIGTGILNNQNKYDAINESDLKNLISSMLRLNKNASEVMIKYETNACTDITGFGIAGHSYQLAKASNVTLHIYTKNIPLLGGVHKAIENNFLTRGDKSNRDYTKYFIKNIGQVDINIEHLMFDPQTSGGLLIAVKEKDANKLLDELKSSGDEKSTIIGYAESIKKENSDIFLEFDYSK